MYGYDVVISWVYRNASFMLPAFDESKRIAWFHGVVDDLLPSSAHNTRNHFYKKMLFKLQKKLVCVLIKLCKFQARLNSLYYMFYLNFLAKLR